MASATSRRLQPDLIEGWDPPSGLPAPNDHLRFRINVSVSQAALISDVMVSRANVSEGRTELDSHANMCVLGKHCYILSQSGKNVDVGAFTESAGGLNQVPIVDAMLAYDCRRTNQVYLLVLRNVLYIDSMEDNLIPPFILREAGIIVNERAKIHSEEPTEEDHTIQCRKTGLFITIQLRSIFSYFPTRKPDEEDILEGVDVVVTPKGSEWAPYDASYAENESALTNAKGEMCPPMYERKEFVNYDDYANIDSILVVEDAVDRYDTDAVVAAFNVQDVDFKNKREVQIGLSISEVAATAVKHFSSDWNPRYESMPIGQDQVSIILSSVSNTIDPQSFYDELET